METIRTRTWNGLKAQLKNVAAQRAAMINDDVPTTPSKLLYRGQSNASWSLDTTLDRVIDSPISLVRYYRQVLATKPEVEAFTNRHWNDLLSYPEYEQWAANYDNFLMNRFPGYEYMVYLRHHGFPSPLLDWSGSPYVAAFFAFNNAKKSVKNVAIYCYMETGIGGKIHDANNPEIKNRGPYTRGHKRHFLQHCQYTICIQKRDNNVMHYCNHEDVFDLGIDGQDYLWKITAPTSISEEALAELNSMNINAFSLFDSEDSLISTLSRKSFG